MLKKIYCVLFLSAFLPPLCLASRGGQEAGKPTALEQFFPFLILGALLYLLLIRPQQKKHKQHRIFLDQIKRGDEVLTNSGIYGRIEGLTDHFVILEVAENVRIRVVKSQISSYSKIENSKTAITQDKK